MDIKTKLLNKYIEKIEEDERTKRQEIAEVTDQEVAELNEDEETEDDDSDKLYTAVSTSPSNFYTLTGFSVVEFNKLYEYVHEKFTSSGRGRKSSISKRDILFILLHYLRRYSRIEEVSAIFGIKTTTLENILQKYIPILAEVLQHNFIDCISDEDVEYDQRFPSCGYVVDATVQEIYKPYTGHIEAKKYFSKKHGIYCVKSQVVVNIKGLAVSILTSIRGAKHDYRVFKKSLPQLNALFDKHPDQPRKILGDKGYQNSESDILVTPIKGTTATLSREALLFNQNLGQVRIIIENFFGRLKSRYEIMSNVFRSDRDSYTSYFIICCALVNFEQIICNHPLREDDSIFYKKLLVTMERKMKEREEMKNKKKQKQAARRKKIFKRFGTNFSNSNSDTPSSSSD